MSSHVQPDDDSDLTALLGDEPVSLPAPAMLTDELHAAEIALLDAWSRLNPRQMAFVQHYCQGATGAAAARAAGYSMAGASKHAHYLLTEQPEVMAAIDAFRAKKRIEVEYGVEAAHQELTEAMQFARETKNATALARCIELRGKLHGLLVERAEVAIDTGPSLSKALELARQRGATVDAKRAPQIVEGTFTEIDNP